jgi:hypothetical protein
MQQVTLTLTQDQAEHVLLCARMALAQAQLSDAATDKYKWGPMGDAMAKRRDAFAGLVLALEAQITER